MKVVICGGHLTPALALCEELAKKKNVEIIFFGRKYSTEGSGNLSAEYEVVTREKIKFYTILAGRLQRKLTKYTLIALLKIPVGFAQSFIYLLLTRPNLVVSFGGYLSLPVVFCAWLLGIDSISHEQTVYPGVASRINSLFVKKIFLAWPQTAAYYPAHKTEVIGNLVRESILAKRAKSAEISTFLNVAKKLIYVTGGNQGSHFLNKTFLESLSLFSSYEILHQVGTTNYKGDWDKANAVKSKKYFPVKYIESGDLGGVLNKVSVVVSRAGANTVWELGLFAKPAVLVPLPIAAGGEQEKNAKVLETAGMAKIIKQEDVKLAGLKREIENIFKNYESYREAALAFSKKLPRDAVARLAAYILDYT